MKVLPSSSSLKYKPKEFHNTTGGNDLFTESKAPIAQLLIYEKSGFHPREKKTTRILRDFRGAIQAWHPPGGSTDVRLDRGPATARWYV